MKTITATEARKIHYKLLDEVSKSHEPIQITRKRNNAVVVSEDDWRAVQETLYLLVYQVLEDLRTVKALRMRTHYELRPADHCSRISG